MNFSTKIKDLIKQGEGLRLKAYKCPAGLLTIGYGHTGRDVKPDMVITHAQAEQLFEADLERAASDVALSIGRNVKLKPNQLEALVSLSYNLGHLPKKAPALVAKVRANPDDPYIRTLFMQYTKAKVNGVLKELSGLAKRRIAEADHYFGVS